QVMGRRPTPSAPGSIWRLALPFPSQRSCPQDLEVAAVALSRAPKIRWLPVAALAEACTTPPSLGQPGTFRAGLSAATPTTSPAPNRHPWSGPCAPLFVDSRPATISDRHSRRVPDVFIDELTAPAIAGEASLVVTKTAMKNISSRVLLV